MKLSGAGLATIRQFEGFRADAYPDPGSSNGLPVTIGYGSTRYEDGTRIALGDTVTRERADELLRHEVAATEREVERLVTVPLTQPQFDALVSFAFNVGTGALAASTLLRKLNAGDYAGAADELLRWNKNDGQVMAGLTRRRRAERELFLAAATAPAPITPTAINRDKTMAPVVAALLPTVVGLIPELAKIFGSGSAVSERNTRAVERVAEVVVAATKAPNLQGAVEAMSADPDARRRASEAVQAAWFELIEVGGGIKEARAFNVATAAIPAWRMPAVWVSSALLALVFMVVGSVLWGEGWKDDIRLQVVTAVLTIIGMVGSFWLGTSASSQRKTDMLAEK